MGRNDDTWTGLTGLFAGLILGAIIGHSMATQFYEVAHTRPHAKLLVEAQRQSKIYIGTDLAKLIERDTPAKPPKDQGLLRNSS